MAKVELINPLHSGDSSPTERQPPQRRTALLRQQLSLDISDQSRALSSSLPSPITKRELSFLKAIHENEKNKKQKLKESPSLTMEDDTVDIEADSERKESSHDGSLSPNQQRMRPRSASLFSSVGERGTPKRKSLRGLSRSRPSSARLGRSRSRADSFKPDETTMEKVDMIMANIKSQLTQLSQEDLVLQERLSKLTEGIDLLINSQLKTCHPALNPTRSVSSGTPRKPVKVVHWKDIDTNDKVAATNASNSESNHNLLTASYSMPLPRLRVCNSSSEVDILLNDGEEETTKRIGTTTNIGCTTHKVLKLPELKTCSSTSSPPPICTIVIEEPDGQIHCPTPSSMADDEVFVL